MQPGLPFSEPPPAAGVPDFYYIRHQRARRYLLRVDDDGRVRVTIPRGGSRRQADAFARRNLGWIEQQKARIVVPSISQDERPALRARAAVELPPLLMQRAAELGLTVAGVSIRNQRSRWGSCGREGQITLNWRLVLMPPAIRDYVIVHELMHLRRMDHSPAYWALVAAVCPGYREARAWLRVHGPALR